MRKPAALVAFTVALFTLSALAKDPSLGATTFFVYEESEMPKALQKSLGATAPSIPREERKSRGWGQLRFARDLSKAYVDVEIQGVNADDIVMFHIHCGPPNLLGPVIVDLGELGDPKKLLAGGKMSGELNNKTVFMQQAKTLGALEHLARKGVLYFNLHTKAHTYYGEMRGQLYLVDSDK
jgi:CHRD domain